MLRIEIDSMPIEIDGNRAPDPAARDRAPGAEGEGRRLRIRAAEGIERELADLRERSGAMKAGGSARRTRSWIAGNQERLEQAHRDAERASATPTSSARASCWQIPELGRALRGAEATTDRNNGFLKEEVV